MKQEKIKYGDIMDLGFNEESQHDNVYFQEYGFDYCIIEKKLTKKIYIYWEKETQLCKMIRIDSHKKMNIKATMPIKNLAHLKEIIDFFSDEVKEIDYTNFA